MLAGNETPILAGSLTIPVVVVVVADSDYGYFFRRFFYLNISSQFSTRPLYLHFLFC